MNLDPAHAKATNGRWLRIALTSAAVVMAFGCGGSPSRRWQGYLTAEFVRVASPLAGTLENLTVSRGDTVQRDGPLFQLERSADEAALREARERRAQAQSRLDNLRKGSRPSELASLEARLEQARVEADLAAKEWRRTEDLTRGGAMSKSELDRAAAAQDRERKRVEELASELETARLGGREDEIRAAQADLAAADAAVARAEWSVDQKQKRSPVEALVHDTLYRPGEWVAAGSPVVSLLPSDRLKVRFFVPESEVSQLKVGAELRVRIDGLAAMVPARLSYIAPEAEYTPPVIYSEENRARLVFMVEAAFVQPEARVMHPGQPVEVLP